MFLLVPAYLGSPRQRAVKRLCVYVCVYVVMMMMMITVVSAVIFIFTAGYMLSSCVCPSVRPSQAGSVLKRLDDRAGF